MKQRGLRTLASKVNIPERKHIDLSINQIDQMYPIVKALASMQRLQMLQMLGTRSMYVNELAEKLDIPVSTAANNIRILEDAGLIFSEQQPGTRGTMKLCHRRLDTMSVVLFPQEQGKDSVLSMSLPVGCFSLAEDIAPTCGLAGTHTSIGEDDNPRSFFYPGRFQAQLIWFRHGYVTYHFSILHIPDIHVQWLELSFEACSEAPMYRDPWKSDIDVSINGARIGKWTSPCDCGGRRGLLNPEWWSDISTQYGMLKTWRVDKNGSYLENMHVSDVTIADLALDTKPYVAVRIGVSPDAENVGGINLFGREFGDFAQDVQLRIGYTMR